MWRDRHRSLLRRTLGHSARPGKETKQPLLRSAPPIPGLVTAVVKRDESPESCVGLDAEAAHKEVAKKVAEAVEKVRHGPVAPLQPRLPMTVTLSMRTMDRAAKAAQNQACSASATTR